MQSSASCDVILDCKGIKFLQLGKLGVGFRLGKQWLSFVKKLYPYDSQCFSKVDVCTTTGLEELKQTYVGTYVQAELRFI